MSLFNVEVCEEMIWMLHIENGEVIRGNLAFSLEWYLARAIENISKMLPVMPLLKQHTSTSIARVTEVYSKPGIILILPHNK